MSVSSVKSMRRDFLRGHQKTPDCVCKGTGVLTVDTSQDNEPHWKAGDVVVACCPYCHVGRDKAEAMKAEMANS